MSVLFTRRGTPPVMGKMASDYEVGDSVFMPFEGENYEYIVVHQGNPDSSIYDVSCDGTWLLQKDMIMELQWHTSNINDYENSSIFAWMNQILESALDDEVRAHIKQVKIPYRPGSGTSKTCNTGANGLSCKIFLLSMTEVGFSESYQPTSEGAKLSYFESGTGTSAKNKRIAKLNGSATYWWLRSPDCGGSVHACGVEDDGSAGGGYCSTSGGFRPAFVIKSTTKFDPNTNIIIG